MNFDRNLSLRHVCDADMCDAKNVSAHTERKQKKKNEN